MGRELSPELGASCPLLQGWEKLCAGEAIRGEAGPKVVWVFPRFVRGVSLGREGECGQPETELGWVPLPGKKEYASGSWGPPKCFWEIF